MVLGVPLAVGARVGGCLCEDGGINMARTAGCTSRGAHWNHIVVWLFSRRFGGANQFHLVAVLDWLHPDYGEHLAPLDVLIC